MDEPEVTAVSKKTYSNRGAWRRGTAPATHGQQILVSRRVVRQCSAAAGIVDRRCAEPRGVLDSLRNDAALLCSYLFFPAHEEGPIPGCTNLEAMEFGSFAGDSAVCCAAARERC